MPEFFCSCGQPMRVPESRAGKPVKCKACGQVTVMVIAAPAAPRVGTFHTKVAGVSHANPDGTPRQSLIKNRCRVGDEVRLAPEPGNPHDRDAIAVHHATGGQLGYLSAELAASLRRDVKAGRRLRGVISDVTGGTRDRPTRGVNLLVAVSDPGASEDQIRDAIRAAMAEARPLVEVAEDRPAGGVRAKSSCLSGCFFWGLIAVLGLGIAGTILSNRPGATAPAVRGLLPEIDAFLRAHPQFGKPLRVQAIPDWYEGPRQRVDLDTGRNLLFYARGGAVLTVYEDQPGRGRVKVWGEYATTGEPPPRSAPAPTIEPEAEPKGDAESEASPAEPAKDEGGASEYRKSIEREAERRRQQRLLNDVRGKANQRKALGLPR